MANTRYNNEIWQNNEDDAYLKYSSEGDVRLEMFGFGESEVMPSQQFSVFHSLPQ